MAPTKRHRLKEGNPRRFSPCPVDGCTRTKRQEHVCCAPHWRAVPQTLRNEIWWRVKVLDVNVMRADCADCADWECSEHQMFRCSCCLRVVPWSFGCADDMPTVCDDCWAAHSPKAGDS